MERRIPIWHRLFASLRAHPSPQDVASVAADSRISALITSANAILFAAAGWSSLEQGFLISWLVLCLMTNVYIAYRSGSAKPSSKPQVSLRTARLLRIFSFVMALPWSILAVAVMGFGTPFDQIMGLVICSGTMAGATFILHRATAACSTFLLTIMGPLLATCLIVDPYHYWPLVLASTIYTYALFRAAGKAAEVARQRDQSVNDSKRTVVELETAYETISKLAFYDINTDLFNRKGFAQALDETMAAVGQQLPGITLLMLDLDRFKNINDTLGHHAGDRLLAVVAERLSVEIDSRDTLARLGGDEFAIIVRSTCDPDELTRLALRLVTAVNRPALIGKHEVYPGTSIGGARYPFDARDSHELLMYADISLNRAKESGRGCFVLFDESIQLEIERRNWIETELRAAMDRDQLHMVYQPKVDLASGQIVGAEALVRWTHPTDGPMDPAEFLSIAAERGLIAGMTRSIAARIAADLEDWQRRGITFGKIAMNLHPLDLRSPNELLGCIDIFASEHISPDDLILEITEGAIVGRGTDGTPMLLDMLNERGFELSLDDFGTGFASLSYLLKMPVREIKVDRGFIRGMLVSQADRAVIAAAVEIANVMDLHVVAEGVETGEQAAALRALGVHSGQGYHWSGPLEKTDLEALIRQSPPSEARAGG
ncbi:putative bifunctional diguanylate cyclase/phosphodiesterase [Amaricoccus macauensis]|uniref:putative bifunctional diguanylate cyclase/phosphodiesterase n=1 Tax=Amaricoccus macauensis TaxID=57001 RepID=UPI003C7C73CE